ncbi:huntingtin-interacting protein K-like [Pollicipes pollicipes]|uniref:huntingtin-interacting protein K-like n=1 Tax=Pollicipes pollicipes TaxID=41117 RepID=UPI001884E104|nr:huntingtin-interacting protein K-like [Pollicipes pollicipes]
MADDGPDSKNQKKSAKHDSGAADLERVTDYAEEKEISSDITGAVATIGERRRKEAQEKMEREIELAKVPIRKDDVELIMTEMEIGRPRAERCLREHHGDVVKALVTLTQ